MRVFPCRDPAVLERLVSLSKAEGFGHLERLAAEWADGTNRFEGDGEVLLVVEFGGRIIACGGLTRQAERLGRVRRVYVDPHFRRLRVGRRLMEALIERGRERFHALVLYTDNPDAAWFYELLGFVPEEPTSTSDHATHRLLLRPRDPGT